MIDVKKNNHLLPLENEEYDISSDRVWVQNLGLKAIIEMERAPVFNDLNKSFWSDHFSKMNYNDLRTQVRLLQLVASNTTKAEFVSVLTTYWSHRISYLNLQ